jgi:hypothetical protein
LRNFAIKNYLNNNNKDVLYNDIEYMIEDYNELIKYRHYQITIDHTFPKDLLVNIMKPYLNLFLISQYSLMYTDRLVAKNLLKQKLYEFNKFNPQFGRKIYKKQVNTTFGININNLLNKTENFQYNTNHIVFNESEHIKDRNEFMQSHLTKLTEQVNDDEGGEGSLTSIMGHFEMTVQQKLRNRKAMLASVREELHVQTALMREIVDGEPVLGFAIDQPISEEVAVSVEDDSQGGTSEVLAMSPNNLNDAAEVKENSEAALAYSIDEIEVQLSQVEPSAPPNGLVNYNSNGY